MDQSVIKVLSIELKEMVTKQLFVDPRLFVIDMAYIEEVIENAGEYNGEFINKSYTFNHYARIHKDERYYNTAPPLIKAHNWRGVETGLEFRDGNYMYDDCQLKEFGVDYPNRWAAIGYLGTDASIIRDGFHFTIERRCVIRLGARKQFGLVRQSQIHNTTDKFALVRIFPDDTYSIHPVSSQGHGFITTTKLPITTELVPTCGNLLI